MKKYLAWIVLSILSSQLLAIDKQSPLSEPFHHDVSYQALGFATPLGARGISYSYMPNQHGFNIGIGEGYTGHQFAVNYVRRFLKRSFNYLMVGVNYASGTTQKGNTISNISEDLHIGDSLWASTIWGLEYYSYKNLSLGFEFGASVVMATEMYAKSSGKPAFCDMFFCPKTSYHVGDIVPAMNLLAIHLRF